MKTLAVTCALVAVVTSAGYAQAPAKSTADPQFSVRLTPPNPPTHKTPALAALQAARTNLTAPKPTVVCGMTMIPADPQFDQKIRKPAPDANTRFTIRAVQPENCRR